MLQDSRLNEILKLVDQKGAVRVDELAKLFNISESTIRRDLIELSKQNKLIKVHGGATATNYAGNITFDRVDKDYFFRENLEKEKKELIARKAASLIKDGASVYLDASTSVASVIDYLKPEHITGLSLLGGEPMEPSNQRALLPFIKRVKELYPQKDIWCYTGYLFDQELLSESRARCEVTDELLSYIDVLVDGKFIEELKDLSLKFRGSSNQRIIDVKQSLEKDEIILYKDLNENRNFQKYE